MSDPKLSSEVIEKEMTGIHNACVYLKDRRGSLVFVSYKQNIFNYLGVASKINYKEAHLYESKAKTLGILFIDDTSLAEELYRTVRVGQPPSWQLQKIVLKHLYSLGLADTKNQYVLHLVELTGIENVCLYMKTIKGDVVGISYKFDILGVPLFAFKASRNAAKEAELYFQNNHIAFVDDPHTAQIIFNNGELSNAIPKETFSPVGRALITSGIIKNSDDSEE